ncbi:hypothetical protein [Roseivirga sp. E12]|uniref:hypothetical protein n=1 Tax=Roseivirga sp. E12 TaxID=2819237 RepID=UPI001ABCE5A2|nr:hypothetical protein [Roseivirga sp. E12]MBO3697871.1 hypothetical protein [Roseivirga sp. E12]
MRIGICIFCLTLLTNCEQDTLFDREFPRIQTISMEVLSPTSIRIFGAITQNSLNEEIVEYGFVWSSGIPNIFGNKVVAKNLDGNQFSEEILNIPTNAALRVRAYAITANNTIYGDTIPFSLSN